MARPTTSERIDALTAAVAALTALVAPIAAPAASSTTAPAVHLGKSGKPDGRRFACPQCGRLFRSTGEAAGAKGGVAWHVREVHAA